MARFVMMIIIIKIAAVVVLVVLVIIIIIIAKQNPPSPLKPRFLALIEQYLTDISDPMYLLHQSCIGFLWLNWLKSTFHPATTRNFE